MNNYGVLIVDVYVSRIVFRRFDVRDGEEYHAENPWVVPWPFDPATAPYALVRRNRNMPKPAFAPDASLKLSSLKSGGGVMLTVPAAAGEPRPFAYRVRLERHEGGRWRLHARRDFFGDAWQRASERPEKYEMEFADAYFCEGGKYRFRLFASNGQQLLACTQGYTQKSSCKNGIQCVISNCEGRIEISKELDD
jgi:uncharacterized protein YegP (UPF0339 family)